MVIMIYRMLAQDLAKFAVVFFVFLMGFSQVVICLSNFLSFAIYLSIYLHIYLSIQLFIMFRKGWLGS